MIEWGFRNGLLIGRAGYDLKDAHDRECLVNQLNRMEKEIEELRKENRNLKYVNEGLGLVKTAIKNIEEMKE